jgi:hypothetical protein
MKTLQIAKRAAAFKACIELYEIGELNDQFLPVKQQDLMISHNYLFPYLKNEETDTICRTGKLKRRHELIVN